MIVKNYHFKSQKTKEVLGASIKNQAFINYIKKSIFTYPANAKNF